MNSKVSTIVRMCARLAEWGLQNTLTKGKAMETLLKYQLHMENVYVFNKQVHCHLLS